MSPYFENVMFSVFDLEFNEEYGINVTADVVQATDIYGHYQTSLKSSAAVVKSISDVDIVYSATITIRTTPYNDAYVNEGDQIKVTHVKDPETRAWVLLAAPQNFTVKKIEVIHPAQRHKVLFLQGKQ